jgi:solute carrier family 25 protein 43
VCRAPPQTISYPFDTIRKKLQAQSHAVHEHMRPDVEFDGMADAFRRTVAKHGVLGLWRGTAANLLKVAPYAGVMFATFEACKRLALYQNGYTVSPLDGRPRRGVPQELRPAELAAWLAQHAAAARGADLPSGYSRRHAP